jgi:hypothetical protein
MRDAAYRYSLPNMVCPENTVYAFSLTESAENLHPEGVYNISDSLNPFSNFHVAKRSKDIFFCRNVLSL